MVGLGTVVPRCDFGYREQRAGWDTLNAARHRQRAALPEPDVAGSLGGGLTRKVWVWGCPKPWTRKFYDAGRARTLL